MSAPTFTPQDVHHIATLANIQVDANQELVFANGFTTTMSVVDQLAKINVAGIDPTHQVIGLENVFREDEIDESRMFTQEQALANAPRTHNGYFVVDQILDQE